MCFDRGRLSVCDELSSLVRGAGVEPRRLQALLTSAGPRLTCALTRLLHASRLAASRRADLDVLIDLLLGVHEAYLLEPLRRAPLSSLRRYDQEHTHLLRPPSESFTPYDQLLSLLPLVPNGGTLLDLGAGNGRLVLTCSLLRPDIRCFGFELVAERVALTMRALRRLHTKTRATALRRQLRKYPCPVVRGSLQRGEKDRCYSCKTHLPK
ncbi:MAG: hypothetical protein SGPRY_012765 [Prymnesium sp.]